MHRRKEVPLYGRDQTLMLTKPAEVAPAATVAPATAD
jgi:hypothetical protein